jgi:hypothetical protein
MRQSCADQAALRSPLTWVSWAQRLPCSFRTAPIARRAACLPSHCTAAKGRSGGRSAAAVRLTASVTPGCGSLRGPAQTATTVSIQLAKENGVEWEPTRTYASWDQTCAATQPCEWAARHLECNKCNLCTLYFSHYCPASKGKANASLVRRTQVVIEGKSYHYIWSIDWSTNAIIHSTKLYW